MLVMHSSGGIHPRDWFFARKLNEMGVAAFVLDSFGPRGLTKVYEKKRIFGEREQAIDALTAMEVLRNNERIELHPSRSNGALVGWPDRRSSGAAGEP